MVRTATKVVISELSSIHREVLAVKRRGLAGHLEFGGSNMNMPILICKG